MFGMQTNVCIYLKITILCGSVYWFLLLMRSTKRTCIRIIKKRNNYECHALSPIMSSCKYKHNDGRTC